MLHSHAVSAVSYASLFCPACCTSDEAVVKQSWLQVAHCLLESVATVLSRHQPGKGCAKPHCCWQKVYQDAFGVNWLPQLQASDGRQTSPALLHGRMHCMLLCPHRRMPILHSAYHIDLLAGSRQSTHV